MGGSGGADGTVLLGVLWLEVEVLRWVDWMRRLSERDKVG